MERATAIFVDGMGAAAATSGVLSQLQGRIFAVLYLHAGPLALEDIASELEQSKSNISVNIRGLSTGTSCAGSGSADRARTTTRARRTSGVSCRRSSSVASAG